MIHMKERSGLVCVMLGIAVVLAGGRSAGADDFEKFQERARQQKKDLISKLMDQHALCIVTVEFIAKESFMGQERKSEMESLAVMVSPDGLVLAANSRLQGMMSMGMRMAGGMMGGMMGSMPSPQSDTEDLKIIIGDDDSKGSCRSGIGRLGVSYRRSHLKGLLLIRFEITAHFLGSKPQGEGSAACPRIHSIGSAASRYIGRGRCP